MRAAMTTGPTPCASPRSPSRGPGPGELLVRPEAVGLCGSDFHYFHGHLPGGALPARPGPRVLRDRRGRRGRLPARDRGRPADRRMAAVRVRRCHACAIGRENACERISLIGIHTDGALQERLSSRPSRPSRWTTSTLRLTAFSSPPRSRCGPSCADGSRPASTCCPRRGPDRPGGGDRLARPRRGRARRRPHREPPRARARVRVRGRVMDRARTSPPGPAHGRAARRPRWWSRRPARRADAHGTRRGRPGRARPRRSAFGARVPLPSAQLGVPRARPARRQRVHGGRVRGGRRRSSSAGSTPSRRCSPTISRSSTPPRRSPTRAAIPQRS